MAKTRKKRRRSRRLLQWGSDYRYVYIMERTSSRGAYARATGQREYKIGIAKNAETRNARVDKSVKGKVRLNTKRYAPNARRLEKALHRHFADSRFRIYAIGRGAGETEWFYLTDLEYACLEYLFWQLWVEQLVRPILLAIIILILLFSYTKKQLIDNEKDYFNGSRPVSGKLGYSYLQPSKKEISTIYWRPIRRSSLG